MYKRILRDWNAFLNGTSHIGEVTAFTPPTVTVLTQDYRAGGLDGVIPIDMGIELGESTITFGGFEPDVAKQVGKNGNASITVRGGLITAGVEGVTPIVYTIEGPATVANFGEFTPGESASTTITVRPTYFRCEHDGATLVEIDIPNQKRTLDGVDQLEALRGAIGR